MMPFYLTSNRIYRTNSGDTVYSINDFIDGIHSDSGIDSIDDYNEELSLRLFLGGLPADFTESDFLLNFGRCGVRLIDWPNKEHGLKPKGYCFIDFETQEDIQKFLKMTFFEKTSNKRRVQMIFSKYRRFTVEVKPFYLKDANAGKDNNPIDMISRQVYIGGLPRDAKAKDIKKTMSHFGEVSEVNIHLHHENLYPKGSATVTFMKYNGCREALLARIFQFRNECGVRMIEVKPMIPNNMTCPSCNVRLCSDFCTHPSCLQLTCNVCWYLNHFVTISAHKKYRIIRGAYYTMKE